MESLKTYQFYFFGDNILKSINDNNHYTLILYDSKGSILDKLSLYNSFSMFVEEGKPDTLNIKYVISDQERTIYNNMNNSNLKGNKIGKYYLKSSYIVYTGMSKYIRKETIDSIAFDKKKNETVFYSGSDTVAKSKNAEVMFRSDMIFISKYRLGQFSGDEYVLKDFKKNNLLQ